MALRYLADGFHGETNRPAQSRHGLVLGKLIVVVRVVRPDEVSPDAKGMLVRVA